MLWIGKLRALACFWLDSSYTGIHFGLAAYSQSVDHGLETHVYLAAANDLGDVLCLVSLLAFVNRDMGIAIHWGRSVQAEQL